MKKVINSENIEGRLYQYDLAKKTVENKESKNYGKEYISGTVEVATDDEGLNVIPVHYTFKTELTNNGKTDFSYGILNNMIEGKYKTWIADGKDEATKVRLSPSIALNDFIAADGTMVAQKVNESGFISIVNGDLAPEDHNQRNKFKCDMLITGVTEVDETEDYPPMQRIKGAIFNFRGDLLPVEFICRGSLMEYFRSIEPSSSEPVFTYVEGGIFNNHVTHTIKEEGAFGSVSVRTVTRNIKEYVIDYVKQAEYEYGAEGVLTVEELRQKDQDRQVYLAGVKKRHDDYIAQRDAAATTAKPVVTENFNF